MAVLRSTQMQVFGITYIAYAVLYVARKCLSVTKADMVASGAASTAELGVMDTSFLVCYALGQLCGSGLTDRLSPHAGLALCYTVVALSLFAFGGASTPLAFNIFWGINGCFQAQVFPLCIRALSPHLDPRTRGKAMGLWTTSQAAGGVMANSLAAYLMGSYGWRTAFMPLPAILIAGSGALLFLGLPPQAHDAALLPTPAAGSSKVTAAGRESMAAVVLQTPGLLHLGLCYFMVKLVRYTLLFWLPLFLHQEMGFTTPQAGLAAVSFDVGAVGGSVFAGVWSDGMPSKEAALVPLCALAAVICALLGATEGYAMPLMFVAGLSIAGPDSLLGSAATQDCVERCGRPERLSKGVSFVNGLGSVGAVLQGGCVTIVLAHSGWPTVWWGCAFLGLGAAAVLRLSPAFSVDRQIPRPGQEYGDVRAGGGPEAARLEQALMGLKEPPP